MTINESWLKGFDPKECKNDLPMMADACKEWFCDLCDALVSTNRYELVGSCNNDNSAYLIPVGTNDEITYYSKPVNSFRISDHWNWHANLKKCETPSYVQCYTTDLPAPFRRFAPERASAPIFAWSVAYFGEDKKYHILFGEVFDRETGKWSFKYQSVADALSSIFKAEEGVAKCS